MASAAEAVRVTVLRHGEVAGRPHVFRGSSDEPLTGKGRRQVLNVAEALEAPIRIAASPRLRCLAVAAEFAAACGLPLETLPDLAEMDFGGWEGLSILEVAAAYPDAYEAFRTHADHAAAPGGESIDVFRRRVLTAWEAWLADGQGGHRLLITHAGVMRILLQHILAVPAEGLFRFALPEAAHFQVSLLPGRAPILLRLNACADSF